LIAAPTNLPIMGQAVLGAMLAQMNAGVPGSTTSAAFGSAIATKDRVSGKKDKKQKKPADPQKQKYNQTAYQKILDEKQEAADNVRKIVVMNQQLAILEHSFTAAEAKNESLLQRIAVLESEAADRQPP
jgi:acyl-coenzyme A synthetase/AMP-(fatty) acid ligase